MPSFLKTSIYETILIHIEREGETIDKVYFWFIKEARSRDGNIRLCFNDACFNGKIQIIIITKLLSLYFWISAYDFYVLIFITTLLWYYVSYSDPRPCKLFETRKCFARLTLAAVFYPFWFFLTLQFKTKRQKFIYYAQESLKCWFSFGFQSGHNTAETRAGSFFY